MCFTFCQLIMYFYCSQFTITLNSKIKQPSTFYYFIDRIYIYIFVFLRFVRFLDENCARRMKIYNTPWRTCSIQYFNENVIYGYMDKEDHDQWMKLAKLGVERTEHFLTDELYKYWRTYDIYNFLLMLYGPPLRFVTTFRMSILCCWNCHPNDF